jgi:K+/H+ antiporter YhaU regulatory subunit KhtT
LRDGQTLRNPDADTILLPGDLLAVLGNKDQCKQFYEFAGLEEQL